MNDYLNAIILGVVEGLTEFIPVSSTGHLIIAGDMLAFNGPLASTFEVFIQAGAILAAVWLYWDRFIALTSVAGAGAKIDERSWIGLSGVAKLAICSAPALVAGALLHSAIKERLFNPTSVAIALVFGGVAMIWIERRPNEPTTENLEQITFRQCLAIGLFQCLSLWPGISRAACTIVGGMVCGLRRGTAAEFSFVAAVPIILAATMFDLLKSARLLEVNALPIFAIGFIVSFVTAVAAIRIFVAALKQWNLVPFGIYRVILGLVVLIALR